MRERWFALNTPEKVLTLLDNQSGRLIHPMEKFDGGLTEIEQRALRELALGAAAREVVVYLGRELSAFGFNYQAVKAAANSNNRVKGGGGR